MTTALHLLLGDVRTEKPADGALLAYAVVAAASVFRNR
jgi:hypothetical protein